MGGKTAAFLTGTSETNELEEIADALERGGVELQMFHSEAAPGQYEIITGPLPPLEAADAIFNIARKHGLRATFAPRLHADGFWVATYILGVCAGGSGAHTHISVHPTTGSSPGSHAYPSLLTTRESLFLAGLLAHLPAVIAFTLPLPQSYARMIDGTASPYLALAGLLAASVIGIRDEMELREQNCTGKMAVVMGEVERAVMGITEGLPLDIESARARLVEEVVQNYVTVNKMRRGLG